MEFLSHTTTEISKNKRFLHHFLLVFEKKAMNH